MHQYQNEILFESLEKLLSTLDSIDSSLGILASCVCEGRFMISANINGDVCVEEEK